MANQTRADAFARVMQARVGSLHEPTVEYLTTLHEQILDWAGSVQRELEARLQHAVIDDDNDSVH